MIRNLSIIFPLFNEEYRLIETFKKILSFKKKVKNKKIEIFFVDDGSKDRSSELIKEFIKKNSTNKFKFFYLKLNKNMGKGYALKYGIRKSSMHWILTTDIDLSVPLHQIIKWEKSNQIKNSKIFFGSRNLKNSKVEKNILRFLLGKIFTFLTKILFNIKLKDTQCGFKLYERGIAKGIFSGLTRYGYIHDLEIALIAKKRKLNIKELPVKWTHKKGSKLNIIIDPIIMFLNILSLKIKYFKKF